MWTYDYLVKCHTDPDSTFCLLIMGRVSKDVKTNPIWCMPGIDLFIEADDEEGSIFIFNPTIPHCKDYSVPANGNVREHFGFAAFCSNRHIDYSVREKPNWDVQQCIETSLKTVDESNCPVLHPEQKDQSKNKKKKKSKKEWAWARAASW